MEHLSLPEKSRLPMRQPEPPVYDSDSILGISAMSSGTVATPMILTTLMTLITLITGVIPDDNKKPFDVREVPTYLNLPTLTETYLTLLPLPTYLYYPT